MASGRRYENLNKQEIMQQELSQADQQIYRIPPFFYIHVLDQNTNVTRMEIGPKTYIRQDNERVVFGPEKMITVPPRHYCVIENPVFRNDNKEVVFDGNGQAKLLHADQEIRLSQDPFPLYPGEVLKLPLTELKVVGANTALKLRAVLDVTEPTKRVAGDEWLFEGPGTYIPRKEVVVDEKVKAIVIKPNQALRLRGRKECVDRTGNQRVTGEEWLVKKTGAYLLGAYEELVDTVNAYVLTEKKALHVIALRTFKDDFAVVRKSGEEWLITMAMTETHIPSVYENVIGVVNITTLTNRQYCVILDPVDDHGKPQLGKKKLVKGEKSFFLMPGESLERGIQDVYVMGEDEGVILKSRETFRDIVAGVDRKPGDRWMIHGPAEYVPPVEVEVICRRHALALRQTEGIYVRNIKSGKVKSVNGVRYILNEDEELWEKTLPPVVERLLVEGKDPLAQRSIHEESPPPKTKRDRTRLVTFRVPHNAVVQIYDFKEKQSRVIFGPELVMLGPDEHFTQLSLSGGKPKKPNVIKSLCLLLGPDFCTDIIVVETADHARLQLQLAYNWHFDVSTMKSSNDAAILFSVPDFVGDACKAIASRIRGAVAQVQFDDFHKNSARIIRSSVFGFDDGQKIRDSFLFPQNNLVITSIDIQSVEPIDTKMRDALQKSVQLAIEIMTKSQEATARHEAARLDQEARGYLERQKIKDEAEADRIRRGLFHWSKRCTLL